MVFHLNSLKKRWNQDAYGDIDFDLMEVVEGLEVACSAFFNGNNFCHRAPAGGAGPGLFRLR